MEKLNEIKETYAKELGYKDWETCINDQPNHNVETLMDEVALRLYSVVEYKSYGFEKTIDLLDAEIDSLKDAYHQETILDRKTVYSSMILETIKAKKKLME